MTIRLYEGLGVGTVPSTPNHINYKSVYLDASDAELIKIAELYGHPIAYAQEQNGELIQNIIPLKNTANKQISTSSMVDLDLHTEAAFHPYKPDYVLLFCLRGDPTAVTTYADVNRIIGYLDEDVLEILQQPVFKTSVDLSFRLNGEPDAEMILPILTKHQINLKETQTGTYPMTYWTMVYDKALMVGTNIDARNSLITFQKAVENSIREVTLRTGDLLVIANNSTVHGRRLFQPRYNGTDRWVRRVMVRVNLPPPSEMLGSVITTMF